MWIFQELLLVKLPKVTVHGYVPRITAVSWCTIVQQQLYYSCSTKYLVLVLVSGLIGDRRSSRRAPRHKVLSSTRSSAAGCHQRQLLKSFRYQAGQCKETHGSRQPATDTNNSTAEVEYSSDDRGLGRGRATWGPVPGERVDCRDEGCVYVGRRFLHDMPLVVYHPECMAFVMMR